MPIVIQTKFNLYEIEPPLVQPCQFANTSKGWHPGYDSPVHEMRWMH